MTKKEPNLKHLREAAASRSEKSSARSVLVAGLALLAALAAATALRADAGQLEFGVDMARRGLWAEALFRFERAAIDDPGNPRILNNLAVAHEAVGKFDEALELYRKAVELDPDNPELKRNYARFVEFFQSFRPKKVAEEPDAVAESQAQESPEDASESAAQPQEPNQPNQRRASE